MRSQLCLALALPLVLSAVRPAPCAPVVHPVESPNLRRTLVDGRVRAAIAEQADPNASEPVATLEPRKEVMKKHKLGFFRTRTGTIVLIVAGSLLVGTLARRSFGG